MIAIGWSFDLKGKKPNSNYSFYFPDKGCLRLGKSNSIFFTNNPIR